MDYVTGHFCHDGTPAHGVVRGTGADGSTTPAGPREHAVSPRADYGDGYGPVVYEGDYGYNDRYARHLVGE